MPWIALLMGAVGLFCALFQVDLPARALASPAGMRAGRLSLGQSFSGLLIVCYCSLEVHDAKFPCHCETWCF